MKSRSLLALLPLLAACQKAPPPSEAKPTASASASPSASAAPAPQRAWFEGAWQGAFVAERHRIELPAGAVKEWKDDDGKRASGPNTLELAIADDGVVTGTSSGALGALVVRGRADDDRLAASLSSDEPNGFHGSFLALKTAEGMSGNVSASSGDSLLVRHGAVVLTRAKP